MAGDKVKLSVTWETTNRLPLFMGEATMTLLLGKPFSSMENPRVYEYMNVGSVNVGFSCTLVIYFDIMCRLKGNTLSLKPWHTKYLPPKG